MKDNLIVITDLVRSIQRSEGNPDCFRGNQASCDRLDCAWRSLCLDLEKQDEVRPLKENP